MTAEWEHGEQPSRASDELRALLLPRALRGYARDSVDQLVVRAAEMLDELEDRARRLEAEHADELERSGRKLETLATEHRKLESQLERTAQEREQLARAVKDATREREQIAGAIEEIKQEREERIAYTERLERELTRHRELESSLKHTVVAAERVGSNLRALTEREAELVLEQARTEARRLLMEVTAKRDLLVADGRRIRAMLQVTQASLDELELLVQEDLGNSGTPDQSGGALRDPL